LKSSQLNAIDRKELMKRVEILASRKSCRHFSKKEIELLLLSHWNRIRNRQPNSCQYGIGDSMNKSKLKNPLVKVNLKIKTALEEIGASTINEKAHFCNRGLNRIEFYDFLHKDFGLTDKDLLPQIFSHFDTNKSGQIEDLEWVECLGILLRGSLDDKIRYAFAVYDTNGDGYIAREEMQGMLKMCIARPGNEDDIDEAVKDIVEIVIKLMDKDHDLKVSKADFQKSVQEEPLLLEAFGPVLPEENLVEEFENTVFAEVIEDRRYAESATKKKRKMRFGKSRQMSEIDVEHRSSVGSRHTPVENPSARKTIR